MLRRNGLLSNGACFDVFQSTQQMIHRNAVNFRSVDQGLFTGMDDMTAALANFNFHVQIGGSVEPADFDSFRVTVTKVGIYVRDQYDFTGDQELGFWSGNSNFVSVLPFPGITAPWGITVDGAGSVYVTGHENNVVMKLPAGATTAVELPFSGLNTPLSVAVDKKGTVYVADRGNGRVLRLPQGREGE